MVTPDEFRRQITVKYRPAFELHSDVEQVMQAAATTPRGLPDEVSRAVDMLFIQAFKAHLSVGELAELALVEDAATIVRRLLELGIQAVYIARDSEEATRRSALEGISRSSGTSGRTNSAPEFLPTRGQLGMNSTGFSVQSSNLIGSDGDRPYETCLSMPSIRKRTSRIIRSFPMWLTALRPALCTVTLSRPYHCTMIAWFLT